MLMRADSKITGSPLPGMRAAADKINAIDILEAVVRTKMQHLIEAVREIECRALVNFVFLIPIGRRDDCARNGCGARHR